MKRFFTTTLLALTATGLTFADEAPPKVVKYSATVTGMVCSMCKKKVRDSFTKHIGAANFAFAKGDKKDEQKIIFESAKSSLTKEDAAKALAEFEDEFKVLTLAPVKEPAASEPKK